MKAVVLNAPGGCENFDLVEGFADPVISDDEVLIKIMATGLNPIDYQMRRGDGESSLAKSPVLGREFSGLVMKVGSKVGGFKQGDRVFAASGSMGSNGTYAEFIGVPDSILAKMPENISFEQAAGIPIVYLTALQIYERAFPSKEIPVLITGGAGGVGMALIKILLHHGHELIYTTFGNEASKKALLETGLSEVQLINYRCGNLAAQVLSANNEKRFALAVDLVGGIMAELCAEVLDMNGTYVDVTALGTDLSRGMLFDKGSQIVNVANYTAALFQKFEYYGAKLTQIANLIEQNNISPPSLIIINGLSTQSITKGHILLEENLTNGAKVVVQVGS